jgi:hypothetical protein
MKKRMLLGCLILLWFAGRAQDPPYPAPPAAPQNIVRAEYFIDTDPGFGNGINIPLTPGVDLSSINLTVNTTGLANGTHRLFIRSLNAEGRWSVAGVREFLVNFDPAYNTTPAPQNILRAEYFIDSDPGFGNGVNISLTPGVNISGLDLVVNTTGLAIGSHRLFVRSLGTEGHWSLVGIREFLVDSDPAYNTVPPPQNLTAMEYFIDTDPGFGNGTPLPFTPAVTVAGLSASINATGLSLGAHRLFIRSRNNEGRWSITSVSEFLVDLDPVYPPAPASPQNIVQAEYFLNTDPGFGNGIPIALTPGANLANIPLTVNTAALPLGSTNRLYIRSRSSEGRWSLTGYHEFLVSEDPAYPAAPPAPSALTRAEYFIDTDPGFGNATPITLTAGVDLQNLSFNANTAGLADGPHTLFVRSFGPWGITAYSNFFVGTPLPLRFLSFSANSQASHVDLRWETAGEVNTSHFLVERSADGNQWTSLGRVESRNTTGQHRYAYRDSLPLAGSSYYRLKQVDRDGQFTYSRILALNRRTLMVRLYPNPAGSFVQLELLRTAASLRIDLIDVAGRVQKSITLMNPAPLVRIPLTELPRGLYHLRIRSGEEEWTERLMKE